MKRDIITINEEKCNGCGLCVPDCPEGALQIIDGKARLVSDLFCDGLGACIGTCPEGAISVETREAEPYNERLVMENVVKQGSGVITAHLRHLHDHGEMKFLGEALDFLREMNIPVPEYTPDTPAGESCGCAGSAAMDMRDRCRENHGNAGEVPRVGSELRQWPVQLKLLNPAASYFEGADLLVAADCVPFAYGDFHHDFLSGKIVIMFCPKLDPYVEEYIEKFSEILSRHDIRSITVARMEVPCCGGVNVILQRAMQKAGKTVPVSEAVISIRGEVIGERSPVAAGVV
ncbi:MAG: 4Fe-4S binding protein [Spirochaetes bacterium]|nr:4Fe-4S binding protein [Spirochaetota bacterium]